MGPGIKRICLLITIQMIISKKHKFVCLNPPKTGTGFREEALKDKADISILHNSFYERARHFDSKRAFDFLQSSGNDFRDYTWFTFIRNPWERIVAWYNMNLNLSLNDDASNSSIDELLSTNSFRVFVYKTLNPQSSMSNYIYKNGQLLDFIGSFEQLEDDMRIIYDKLSIEPPNIFRNKDKYKKNFKSKINELWTGDLIAYVGIIESDAINLKKYKFERFNK